MINLMVDMFPLFLYFFLPYIVTHLNTNRSLNITFVQVFKYCFIFWITLSSCLALINFDYRFLKPFVNYFLIVVVVLYILFIKNNFQNFMKFNFYYTFYIVLLTSILILPYIVDFQDYAIAQKIGPDASGYLISTNYILNGGTISDLTTYVLSQNVSQDLNYIFLPGNSALPQLESYDLKIASEFILGSVRFTSSSTSALLSILSLNNNSLASYIFFILNFYFFAFRILVLFLRQIFINDFYAITISFIILLNPMLLNLHLEGGLAQVIVLPIILYIFYSLSINPFINLFSLSNILFIYNSILFYPDLLFILLILLPVYLLLLYLNKIKFIFDFKIKNFIFFSFLILYIYVSGRGFYNWIIRRFSDASQGGWLQAHWPSLSDLMGFTNPFEPGTVGLFPREVSELAWNALFSILILLFISKYNYKSFKFINEFKGTFFYLFALYFIYFLFTNLYSNLNNYQILKIFGSLTPFFALIFIILFYTFLKNINFEFILIIPSLILSLNTYSYLLDYLKTDHHSLNTKIINKFDELSKNYNLIFTLPFGTGGLGIQNLATSSAIDNIKIQYHLNDWYKYMSSNDSVFIIPLSRCQNLGCKYLLSNSKSEIYDDTVVIYPYSRDFVKSYTFYGYFVKWFDLKNFYVLPKK